ncbi:AfsR/SARP family transcriptional regulator [Catenulispora rubra]|uniref:AfsR/SARP family transcriptional regulator n=1 Tax=Catenulispora rubra TaxID=280293 RepID=UPI0018928556|nr:AfsR/SARP family transcriptional regulator [Catenulispora rubra]
MGTRGTEDVVEPDVRLLGPLEIRSRGAVVPLGGGRSRRLAAMLLLNANNVVSTDRLVDVLWETAPQSARQQVHNAVRVLRQRLADVDGITVATAPLGYRIELADECLDLARFRALVRLAETAADANRLPQAIDYLTQACGLWRGSALAGLEGQHLKNFSVRLEEERALAAEQRLALRVRAGDAKSAIAELVEFVEKHPLREAPRASLMIALHATGRQVEALEAYDQGRQLLAEEYGLDPSLDLQELHRDILKGHQPLAVTLAVTTENPAPPSTTPAASAQASTAPEAEAEGNRMFLPHVPKEFSGRGRELRRLIEESQQTSAASLVMSAISGMGGVGKTALAVSFAHSVVQDYPDGQYFVDMRGFTAGVGPLSPEAALGILLRQNGLSEELIPLDLEERASVWRSRMAGRRAILLIDNVFDSEQVRPLLPGAGGPLVLITSRRRLVALEGAASLVLDTLPTDEAASLFTKVAGTDRCAEEQAAVVRVVELCGCLPLAIRIAAARFRDRRSWSVAYLAEQLSDRQRRVEFLDGDGRSVSKAIGVSYFHLPPDSQRFFRALSLNPGTDITASTAAALMATSEPKARTQLEALLDDNLIIEDNPRRYRLHDLVQDHASRLTQEQDAVADRRLARDRLIDHYQRCAAAWGSQLARGPFRFLPVIEHPGPEVPSARSPTHALSLFRAEHANLLETARAAVAGDAAPRGWQLVCLLQPYLRHMNYSGDSLRLLEGALAIAQAIGSEPGEALCLHGAALAHREHLRHEQARTLLKAAIAINERRGDRSAVLYQLIDLGVVLLNDGRLREAYDSYSSALTMSVEAGADLTVRSHLRNNLGVVCSHLGRFEESRTHLAEALAGFQEVGLALMSAKAMANLGLLDLRAGRTGAGPALDRALTAARTSGAAIAETLVQAGICEAHSADGDVRRALTAGRTALALARSHGFYEAECISLIALGEAYLVASDTGNADTVLTNALVLARRRQLSSCIARACEGLGHRALLMGDSAKAKQWFEQSLAAYPADEVDADNPRSHLADAVIGESRCRRCRVLAPTGIRATAT